MCREIVKEVEEAERGCVWRGGVCRGESMWREK